MKIPGKSNRCPRPHPCTPYGGGKAPNVAQWSGCGCDCAQYGVHAGHSDRGTRRGIFMGKTPSGNCYPPLRHPCPQGGGGACDASELPVRDTPSKIVFTKQKLRPPRGALRGGGRHLYRGMGDQPPSLLQMISTTCFLQKSPRSPESLIRGYQRPPVTGSIEILFFKTLSGICEGDPLTPPEGEAAQGGDPP